MADLDADLGHRLARLAESVPVAPWLGHVEPSPVAARQRVRMAWLTPLAFVLVILGAVLGHDLLWNAGVIPFDGPIELWTHRPVDGEICPSARNTGVLVRDPRSGLGVSKEPDGRRQAVRWPSGYGARIKDGRAELLSPGGTVVAREGDGVILGGAGGRDPDGTEYWLACHEVQVSGGATPGKAGAAAAASVDQDGAFALELRADSEWYAPGDAIEVTASLLYSGSLSGVEYRHDDSGPIAFGIRERVFGGSVGGISELMWEHTTLERWVPLVKPFQKGGSTTGDDPEAELFMAWVQAPILQLPEGTWHLFATARGDQLSSGDPPFTLTAEIVIVVSDNPAATPGPATPEPFRNLPVYGGDDIGWFTLQLKSERARYEAGEPIELSAWYTASDSGEPRVIVSHLQPEAAFAIEQLDAIDPETKTSEPATTCSDLGLIPMAERHVRLTPDNLMLLKADPLPPRFLEELGAGVLRLPVGSWRITVDIRGTFGQCVDPGDAYALHASVEIEVVERLD